MNRALRPVLAVACALASVALSGCENPSGADPVESVRVAPDTAYVRINTTQRLEATALDRRGPVREASLTWTSADSTIASVSAEGVVTARKYGVTTVTAAAGAVSGSATVWVTGTPGAHITSGDAVDDTIGAILLAPLVVEVRDSLGMAMVGREVVFFTAPGSASYPREPMTIGLVPAGGFGLVQRVVTDAEGRAAARVRMATQAGPAAITVRLDGTAYADTAHYVVRPGAPARVRLAPRDTVFFAGRQVVLRTSVTDRMGHPIAAPVAYSVAGGGVAVNAVTGVVTSSAFGTSFVVARVGQGVDSVRVSAVPEGALVAATPDGIVLMNFDGTGRRVLGPGTHPAWAPSGDAVVYTGSTGRLVTQGLSGAPAQLASGVFGAWPQYTRDGTWIYYQDNGPMRARADGGRFEGFGPGSGSGHPSPSPDGSKVVHYQEYGLGAHIRIFDLVTKQHSPVLAEGHAPTWSPTGDLIAFNEVRPELANALRLGGLMVIRPDGTGLRRIAPTEGYYYFSPRWSPDGRWVIASGRSAVHLVHVETGMIIPLPFFDYVYGVDWRPGPLLP